MPLTATPGTHHKPTGSLPVSALLWSSHFVDNFMQPRDILRSSQRQPAHLSVREYSPQMNRDLKQRLAYALAGLFAGNALLLLYLMANALRVRAALLAAHVGEPGTQIPIAFQIFTLYGIFSLVGWLIVGIPVVVFLPVSSVTRWPWPLVITVGAFLGPLALLIILIIFSRGHLPASFAGTGALFAFSAVVSTVAFGVYVTLLRKQLLCTR